MTAAMSAVAGIVTSHAETMFRATRQRTLLMRWPAPAPMTVEATGGSSIEPAALPLIAPETIAGVALDLATTDGTGRCRAVRERGEPVDWRFPDWRDLARA